MTEETVEVEPEEVADYESARTEAAEQLRREWAAKGHQR